MRNNSKNIEKARMALQKGDTKKATSLLHQILQKNINDTEVWLILYRQWGGNDSFETFQQTYTKKNFPRKLKELMQTSSSEQDDSAMRRVSLSGSKSRTSQAKSSERDDMGKQEKKPGFFARLFGGLGRKKKVNQEEPNPLLRTEKPGAKPKDTSPTSTDKSGLRLSNLKTTAPPPVPTSVRDDLSIIPSPSSTPTPISSFQQAPSISDDEKIHVLVVDDVSQTRENLIKLMSLERNFKVVGAARTGAEGVKLAVEKEPDVILMDINMPDMDGLEATRLVKAKLPYVQVIVLTVQDDPNYMREAIVAGARDYLIKPPTIDELVSAVQRAYVIAREEKARMPPPLPPEYAQYTSVAQPKQEKIGIISVFSPKGGAGCTTLAANLAVSLQSDTSQVIIVDGCMHFGGVAVSFNERVKNTLLDLTPRVDELDPEVVAGVALTHAASRVKVLPAPEKITDAEAVIPSQLAALLKYLAKVYSYVIVDAGSQLNDHALSILDVSDLVLVVTTQDLPALDRVRRFLDLIPLLGMNKDRIKLVLNRYNDRINITPDRISANLRQEIAATLPYDPPVVTPSTNSGSPFVLDVKVKGRPIYKAMIGLATYIKNQRERED